MQPTDIKAGKELWVCPKCGRQFLRKGQTHSCRAAYALENHFEGKPESRLLYERLKKMLKAYLGPFRIESLECCIHLASTCTFAAVSILKDKIRVDFSLHRKMKNKRIMKSGRLSASRYVYQVDISDKKEIDEELLRWIRESYDKEVKRAASPARITS